MTALLIRDLTKTLARAPVLRGLSCDIEPGTTLLLGANGAGKSTLLRLLAGLLSPEQGAITYPNGRSPRENFGDIGFLGHKLHLYPQLTVAENLRLFRSLSSSDPINHHDVETWGLEQRLQQPVQELSKGLALRTSLCRLFMQMQSFVLLDEPTNALDETGCATLISTMQQRTTNGDTLIVATHDITRLAPLASRIIVLQDGKIAADSKQYGLSTTLERYRTVNR